MSTDSLPNELARTASHLLESLGTSVALSAAIMLRHGDYEGVSRISVDPRRYIDPDSYFRDAAAAAFLKKFEKLPSKVDKRAAALTKWWEGERSCYRSNERLSRYERCFSQNADVDEGIAKFLSDAKKQIYSWLGSGPPTLLEGRFGPGATYSDRGGKTTIPDKMSFSPSLTRDACWYLPQWLGTQWGAALAQRHGEFSFVPGNRFATVPKTALTDRSIASEPSINGFYQLALGRAMRDRLRENAGWDLESAQDIHRRVACESSVTREFATLDLSNASDTICRNLVRLLLPPLWFSAMDDLRSKKTLVDGRWVVLEKFSSMGNGFTFELETIIFAAVCATVEKQLGRPNRLGKDVFVFGDDLIVRNDVVNPVVRVLEFLGFSLNLEKSFYDDVPFRESCGGDYFNGFAVRPYYQKNELNEPQDFIAAANGLSAMSERLALTGLGISRRAWFSLLDCVPTRIRNRCRGPKALGDIVIHDDQERWTTRWKNCIRYISCYRPHRMQTVKFAWFRPEVVLACATYGTGNRNEGVIPRGRILSYKVGWVPYS